MVRKRPFRTKVNKKYFSNNGKFIKNFSILFTNESGIDFKRPQARPPRLISFNILINNNLYNKTRSFYRVDSSHRQGNIFIRKCSAEANKNIDYQ